MPHPTHLLHKLLDGADAVVDFFPGMFMILGTVVLLAGLWVESRVGRVGRVLGAFCRDGSWVPTCSLMAHWAVGWELNSYFSPLSEVISNDTLAPVRLYRFLACKKMKPFLKHNYEKIFYFDKFLESFYRGSILDSPRPSICRRHSFRSITEVHFGISISNLLCMLFVAMGNGF